MKSHLKIIFVYPDLLSTYGDRGNAIILAQRARWRGVDARVVEVTSHEELPLDGDIYVLGGGEDGPQQHAAIRLHQSGFAEAFRSGNSQLLAVCAGFQIIGETFYTSAGSHQGLGLIQSHSRPGKGKRRVGELATKPTLTGLDSLSGFENHQGDTNLDHHLTPLGTVAQGTGNDSVVDGVTTQRIIGTYMHGPVLARNPQLADLLLARALRVEPTDLADLDPQINEAHRLLRHNLGLLQ